MYSFMGRLVYQLKTWQNFCNISLNKMFVRHVGINSSTQKSNRICINWWNSFTFKRKKRNINDFTFIYYQRPRFRGSKRHPSPNATAQWYKRTWVTGIDGDIKNILSTKALTGVDVMVLKNLQLKDVC